MSLLQLSVGWALLLLLQVLLQPALSALFTVEAERTSYKSQFGGSVVMGCRFRPLKSLKELKITWLRTDSDPAQQLIRVDDQMEQAVTPGYQGRVQLLTNEVEHGWAKLQISSLRIHDSGTYQCLVHTEEGADYKTITLSVFAPYKTVSKRVEKAAEADQVVISCQSVGYPKSSVAWQDGHMKNHTSNTTAVQTKDQLVKITSQIRVSATERNNYTCQFSDGASVTFHIPDDIPAPHAKKDALIIVLSIGVMMLFITAGVLTYRRRKGFNTYSTRNLLSDGPCRSVCGANACPQIDPENENENTSFRDGSLHESSSVTVREGGTSST